MNIAFIGIGNVGFALANNLQKRGHTITIAHNNPDSESVIHAQQRNPAFRVETVQEAIDHTDITFLAVPFSVNESLLRPLSFKNKILVDCTNPVGPGLSHGLGSKTSGSERVQTWAGDARVVKSFSIYGFENFEDTTFPRYDVKPAMFIAGDDETAKKSVGDLNTDLGFETVDTGPLTQALHLEHMTLLWVRMVRAGGRQPHLTWAKLQR